MKRIFIALFLSVTISFSASAQADIKGDKMNVMTQMWSFKNALTGKDSVALSKLLSDDLSYGHSTGLVQTKAQLIRDVMSGQQDYKSIEPSNMNIRLYDNTAIVTLQSKVNLLMQGKPLDLNMNVLLVWIKKNNEWKMVARQSAKIAQ